MHTTQIQEYATILLKAHGDAAEAEAVQRAREHDEQGDAEQAANRRRVRSAIASQRGPHVS